MLPSDEPNPFLGRPREAAGLLSVASALIAWFTLQVFRASSDCVVFRGLSVVKVPYYLVHFFLSRGSSPPRNESWVSCFAGRFFTSRARREAH